MFGPKTILRMAMLAAFVLPAALPAPAQEKLNGCDMDGTAKGKESRKLNRLKNRYERPMPEDYARYNISIDSLLAAGDDRNRFSNSSAAEVVGWVKDVKIGGVESCNCNSKDSLYRDTHIVLAAGPKDAKATRTVIAEVTPRWRAMMRQRGLDWTTRGLKKALVGKWVRIRGWMLYDWQYREESENTNPGSRKNWRATAWEIHPVISFEVLEDP
jgi:hypothetical protein